MRYKHQDLTKQIIAAFYIVYNRLGYGFLERVYENAMVIELQTMGLKVKQQTPIKVRYRGQIVGEYFADLIVEDKVIVELKAVLNLLPSHEAQLLNYLKATPYEVGLLLNFGPSPTKKRKIFDNNRKPNLQSRG
ncbi:MAG: GxxExxY protein [Aquificales bacterium]|nr:GxxExxY protein [Aquificales bacterium]